MMNRILWLLVSIAMIVVGCVLFTGAGGYAMFGAFVMLGGLYSTTAWAIICSFYDMKKSGGEL